MKRLTAFVLANLAVLSLVVAAVAPWWW